MFLKLHKRRHYYDNSTVIYETIEQFLDVVNLVPRHGYKQQVPPSNTYGHSYGAGGSSSGSEEGHSRDLLDQKHSMTFVPTDGCADNIIFQVAQLHTEVHLCIPFYQPMEPQPSCTSTGSNPVIAATILLI